MKNEILKHEIIEKPWGHEEIFAKTDKYIGKKIFIKRGETLSLQYHKVKTETILVISGILCIETREGETKVFHTRYPGETFHVPTGMIHRFSPAYNSIDIELIEISTPELDDVVRLEDKYGR